MEIDNSAQRARSYTALEDLSKSVVYIPYEGPDDSESLSNLYTLYPERDFPDAYQMRMDAYKAAWTKCLARVQEILRAIYTPVIEHVVERVTKAYTEVVPGLPYTELPVITVNAASTYPSFLNDITERLEEVSSDEGLFELSRQAYVTHLFPSECSNVMLTIRNIVHGFTTRPPDGGDGMNGSRSGGSKSLAAYDIKRLEAWYDALREAYGKVESLRLICSTHPPEIEGDDDSIHLVAVLHEFEQFESAIIEDLVEICSIYIPRIPLVFILSLSSPSIPYLRSSLSRATMSLMHVVDCPAIPPTTILNDILSKTFFDPDFEPAVMLGPVCLDYLVDFFSRHDPSVDSFITILQLAHMKHFEDPLTIFAFDKFPAINSLTEIFLRPSAFRFLDSILARVHCTGLVPFQEDAQVWQNESFDALLSSISLARTEFFRRVRLMKIAFQFMRTIQIFLLRQGFKSADMDMTFPELMDAAMRGKLGHPTKYLVTMIKKLSMPMLDGLLADTQLFFQRLSEESLQLEEEIVSQIKTARIEFGRCKSASDYPKLAALLAHWVTEYFQARFLPLDQYHLSDIWYTGFTPFPTELINPSVRASIISGLLYPHEYLATPNTDESDHTNVTRKTPNDSALWKLPDISILFRRYLDSGKMINVYDWFESFASVLEHQNQYSSQSSLHDKGSSLRGSQLSSSKGKGKEKQSDFSQRDLTDVHQEWQAEVQARFIRALHELDYIGFIKHTGRKPDHVMKTVFDLPDSE